MTTEPVTVEPPRHPTHALTTFELTRYRGELEHALDVLREHAPIRGLLQERLAEVLAEQEDRSHIARGHAPAR